MDKGQRARYLARIKKGILAECVLVMLAAVVVSGRQSSKEESRIVNNSVLSIENDYIKWVDFTVSYEALCCAYDWDVKSHGTEHEICWVALFEGEKTPDELTEDLKYYSYYREAYDAAIGGLVGEDEEECEDGSYEQRYGLKGYFPLARGFDYTHYDDFGVSRSYGYKRQHLGHDMMGLTGTPIMAVESGIVEALGWNQYGGWRIGLRSFDGKRYYYYAHLRQNYPYAEGLAEGSIVTAGDVIGYMGHTGYSAKENVNNIEVTHLHWGLQLIFDESQKEGNNEIWIDIYPLTRFLSKHTQAAAKVEGTKEWKRTNRIVDPAVEKYMQENHLMGNELTESNR